MEIENPTQTSKLEYKQNRAKLVKPTDIANIKPEAFIDKRIVESEFQNSYDKEKSFKVAQESKSIRLNRR